MLRGMQCLQHKSVTPQGHDHICIRQPDITVGAAQIRQRLLCKGGWAGNKCDFWVLHGVILWRSVVSCHKNMHETQVTDRKPKRPRQVRAEADWCF